MSAFLSVSAVHPLMSAAVPAIILSPTMSTKLISPSWLIEKILDAIGIDNRSLVPAQRGGDRQAAAVTRAERDIA